MSTRVSAIISAQADTALPFAEAEDWLVKQAAPLVVGCHPELTGLYLATKDAGVQASIQFWKDGLRDGLGFANPRDFPRTLANSPSSRLAIQHRLCGPNYILVGGDEATIAALEQAQDDLVEGLVESALVIRFDMMPLPHVIGMTLTYE